MTTVTELRLTRITWGAFIDDMERALMDAARLRAEIADLDYEIARYEARQTLSEDVRSGRNEAERKSLLFLSLDNDLRYAAMHTDVTEKRRDLAEAEARYKIACERARCIRISTEAETALRKEGS
jgi:hypothetical protein